MAIITNILITERNLAGNAVVAKLYAGSNASKRYRIYGEADYATLIYEGLIYSLTDTYSEIDISSLFVDRKKTSGVDLYKIVLVNDSEEESDETFFSVYGGAISKLMQRKLGSSDIFTSKLKVSNNNFLLTTRTADRVIVIPEDELLPIYYYAKGLKFNVKANGETIESRDYSEDTDESLHYIDIAELRSSLVTSENVLVNVFDVVTDTSYGCSILITQADRRTDFFLKFRNSWGAWDMLGIRGEVDYTPAFVEPTKINQWDETVNDFITNHERKELTNTLTASTGYKNDDERLLLLDMLFSSEVILIAYGTEYAVNVTSDSTIFGSTKTDPQTVNLKLELKDTDGAFSPIVIKPDYEPVTTTTLEEIEANGATIIV